MAIFQCHELNAHKTMCIARACVGVRIYVPRVGWSDDLARILEKRAHQVEKSEAHTGVLRAHVQSCVANAVIG